MYFVVLSRVVYAEWGLNHSIKARHRPILILVFKWPVRRPTEVGHHAQRAAYIS
jgi:hypothetical protein